MIKESLFFTDPPPPSHRPTRKSKCVSAIALILLLLFISNSSQATSETHRTVVHFKVNKSTLDPTSFKNTQSLDSLRSFADLLKNDTSLTVSKIHFEAYASPEGPDQLNKRLAKSRREALQNFLRTIFPYHDSITEYSTSTYSPDIADAYARASSRQRHEMVKTFDPLRYAAVEIFYSKTNPPLSVEHPLHPPQIYPETDWTDHMQLRPISPTPTEGEESEADESLCRPFYMSVRTNMLYDALLIPTLGGEFYLGADLSVAGQWSYAWWSRDSSHRYWRFYGGDLGLRWWFGRHAGNKPLTGHHLGLFGQLFTYDIETGGKGEMGAKFNYGGGIEYGFALPVARRLNIDFSIGLGYITGKYYKYTPIDSHYVWQSTHTRRWFGPTKAEISLVWLIGCGNYNTKGGRE